MSKEGYLRTGKIFLVGLMGAGKTTIGRLLANQLGKQFIDADHEIESRCGVKISYIFDVEGEEGFRKREAEVLADLTQMKDIVLATGGGAVTTEGNRQKLSQNGLAIYLSVSPGQLAYRMRNDQQRPLLQNQDIGVVLRHLHGIRNPWYREVADFVISSARQPPKRIVTRIIDQIQANYHEHTDH